MYLVHMAWVEINTFFRHKIVSIIYLSISFNICFGFSKDRLIETVLFSTHNIWFGLEIRKKNIFIKYTL